MALVLVLLMCSLLLLMVLSLIMMLRGELFVSQKNFSRTSGLYLAESGVARSMLELENDDTWAGGTNLTVAGIPGSYSVQFNSAAPFSSLDSVNNLNGAGFAESYRGPNTVPPHSALLIVNANVGGVSRVLEVLVTRGSVVGSLNDPILSSGRVLMQGDVSVNGITSLTDNTPVPAGIQSNLSGNVSDAVQWVNGGSNTANITGTVSSSSSAGAAAISMPGATVTGGTVPGAAPRPLPNIDVLSAISGKTSSPAPVINGTGTTVLGTGDYYHSGDLVINAGDLQLDGASLYVSGKLTVNGTIAGNGSVYVGGETRFQGDARLTAKRDNNVAVFSKGSLYLEGFNGTQYLESVAAGDPLLASYYGQIQTVVADMQTKMNSSTPADMVAGGSANIDLEAMRRSLGQSSAGATWAGTENDLFYKAARHLETTQAPGSSRDFLIRKFDDLDRVYDNKLGVDNFTLDSTRSASVVRDDWANETYTYMGWLDALLDGSFVADMPGMVNFTNNVDYNALGSSYFQGMIYTNGFVYAANDVTVIGAVVARDDSSQAPAVIGGETVRPGDLFLTNGTKVTFVQDLFDGTGFVAPGSELSVVTWMGR